MASAGGLLIFNHQPASSSRLKVLREILCLIRLSVPLSPPCSPSLIHPDFDRGRPQRIGPSHLFVLKCNIIVGGAAAYMTLSQRRSASFARASRLPNISL